MSSKSRRSARSPLARKKFHPKLAARGFVRYGEIVAALRGQIVSGELAGGARLPTRVELEEQFGASSATIQTALTKLMRSGFVVARGRAGSFVAANPPHLCRYGMVFTGDPAGPWSRFCAALSAAAQMFERARPPVQFPAYYNVNGQPDGEDFQRLLRDLQEQRLAGLIFPDPPFHLAGTPVLDRPDVPRVLFRFENTMPELPGVEVDWRGLIDRALDWFVSRGRRRIAVISTFTGSNYADNEIPLYVQSAIAARGLQSKPYWNIPIQPMSPDTACCVAQLLLDAPAQQRPDALLISDDHLLEQAAAGVLASDVQVPRDLDIVGHCNFPLPPVTVVPVRRLGYDLVDLLEAFIISLKAQREAGDADQPKLPTPRIVIPPRFEDELPHGRASIARRTT